MLATIYTGKNLIKLKTIDSTNQYAKVYISKTTPIDGTVILAESQFSGRGQQNNKWYAKAGESLTFSIIYHTSSILAKSQFLLSMAVSIGIIEGLQDGIKQEMSKEFKIKWPNDIYYKNKKLGGILIENTIAGVYLKHSIVGIGLNINQTQFPEKIPNPTSLNLIMKEKFNLEDIFNKVLQGIEKWMLKLQSGGNTTKILSKSYYTRLLGYGEILSFKTENQSFKGKVVGVENSGKLIIEKLDKELVSFGFKEIEFLL